MLGIPFVCSYVQKRFAFWLYSADHKDGMQPDQVLPRCSRFFMENMNSLHAAHAPKTSLEILKDGSISGISTHNSKEIYESFSMFYAFLPFWERRRRELTKKRMKKKNLQIVFHCCNFFCCYVRFFFWSELLKQLTILVDDSLLCIVCLRRNGTFVCFRFLLYFGHWQKWKKKTKVQQGRRTNNESEIEWTKQLETLPLKDNAKRQSKLVSLFFPLRKTEYCREQK